MAAGLLHSNKEDRVSGMRLGIEPLRILGRLAGSGLRVVEVGAARGHLMKLAIYANQVPGVRYENIDVMAGTDPARDRKIDSDASWLYNLILSQALEFEAVICLDKESLDSEEERERVRSDSLTPTQILGLTPADSRRVANYDLFDDPIYEPPVLVSQRMNMLDLSAKSKAVLQTLNPNIGLLSTVLYMQRPEDRLEIIKNTIEITFTCRMIKNLSSLWNSGLRVIIKRLWSTCNNQISSNRLSNGRPISVGVCGTTLVQLF
jgi:hypothetical protein